MAYFQESGHLPLVNILLKIDNINACLETKGKCFKRPVPPRKNKNVSNVRKNVLLEISDVSLHIASCEKCQLSSNFVKSSEELYPIPIVSPGITSGWTESKIGNNYILRVVDYFF